MCWLYLLFAGAAEILFVLEMKLSDGLSKAGHTLGSVVFGVLGFVFLSFAMKKIPVATAYAIWTGIGVVGTIILENALFHVPFSPVRVGCIAAILTGIIGLKLF